MKMTMAMSDQIRRADAELLLWAIINGFARWEWLGERRESGEACVEGLRHCCDVDDHHVILTKNVRSALLHAIG